MTDRTEIHVLDKKIRLLQPEKGFRTSIDAVLLAAACPAKSGETVLDMGCGVGPVGLCVRYRVPDAALTGVDFQEDYIALAQENAQLNGVQEGAAFVCADIRNYESDARFHHVVCNPPFMEAGQHLVSPEKKVAVARGHNDDDLSLRDWVDAAFRNVKSGGSLSVIHRADAVDRIIHAIGKRFGAVEIIPLWPKSGRNAKRVIVRAIKDRKTPATLHAGLTLHEEDGEYTAEAEKILREGEALFC